MMFSKTTKTCNLEDLPTTRDAVNGQPPGNGDVEMPRERAVKKRGDNLIQKET